jgi:hypothetical protein
MIAVYNDKHMTPKNTKCRGSDKAGGTYSCRPAVMGQENGGQPSRTPWHYNKYLASW